MIAAVHARKDKLSKRGKLSTPELRRCVERMLTDLGLLRADTVALRALSVKQHRGFLKLAQLEITTAHIIRLGRILDDHPQSFGVRKLRSERPDFEARLQEHDITWGALNRFKERIADLRSNHFGHTRIAGILSPDAAYKRAKLSTRDIDKFATGIVLALEAGYPTWFDAPPPPRRDYDASDVPTLLAADDIGRELTDRGKGGA